MNHYDCVETLRAEIRGGRYRDPTAGQVPGFVQANLVVVPEVWAADFAEFCRRNPRACPLLEQLAPGAISPQCAPDADLRTDLPRYRVFRQGRLEPLEPTDVGPWWRDDLVSFLLGCSFTFESALIAADLPPRHIELATNVPMYRTTIACESAGAFAGPLVVSMRPYPAKVVAAVVRITGLFPEMHGAPLHIGDPSELGIEDLDQPDFGQRVPLLPGDVPMFWACGVTPQLALQAAAPDLAITHSPGCMFITDLADTAYQVCCTC